MDNLVSKIALLSKGVLLNTSSLQATRQIKLKYVFEYDFYLYVHENKVYFYTFENTIKDVIHPYIQYDNNIMENMAKNTANFFYNSSYYKIRFKELDYSKNADKYINDVHLNEDTLINVYSYNDITQLYPLIHDNTFDTIRIVSNLLYKIELDNYIKTFKIANLKMS